MTGTKTSVLIHDDWDRHLVIMRHIVRRQWSHLKEMSLHQYAKDDSFCHFALEQHLANFIVRQLGLAEQTSLLPGEWTQPLVAAVMLRQDARERLKAKLREIHVALSAAGLAYRVLKGIPFAQRYFGDPALRRSADIDLLVQEHELNRVLSVLYDLGYSATTPQVRITSNGPTVPEITVHREHELTITHEQIEVDLHWRLRTAPAYHWRESEIWGQRDVVDVDGVSYPVLTDEYALVLLLVSSAHDIARGGCRLKHFLDMHQLLSCGQVRLDWPIFLKHREAESTLGIAVNMLRMVLDVWANGDELPDLRSALEPYAALQSRRNGTARTIELIRSPRGGVENKLWFAEVYGIRWMRDAAWILRRSIPHPARWPGACLQVARFVNKSIRAS